MADATTDPSVTQEPEKPETPPKEEGKVSKRISDLVAERDAERKLREDADAKLAEFERKEKELADAKLKEQGEFEKLLSDRENQIKELNGTTEQMKKQLEAYDTATKSQIDKAMEGIADEKRKATVEKLLAGKSLAEQAAILPEILELTGTNKPVGNGTPPSNSALPGTVEAKKQEYYQLGEKLTKGTITPRESQRLNALTNELSREYNSKEAIAERSKMQASSDVQTIYT